MPENQAGERTEEATPRRRQEARRKGMVARSPELSGAATFLALVLILPLIGGSIVTAIFTATRSIIGDVAIADAPASDIIGRALRNMLPVATAVAPLLLVGVVVGLATNFMQVGFHFSSEALQPQLNRLNPLQGFKKIVSSRAMMEGAKALVKTLLIAYIAYATLSARVNELQELGPLPPMAAISVVGSLILAVVGRVALCWLVLAVIDYWFQKKQMDKQLMMTKDEVRREMKEMEQGPELKMALARRRAQLARNRMMQAVQKADAVIVNPTHYAVAIKYDSDKMAAPQVVAKGRDLIAQRIREEANKHRVPIIPNAPLAQSLHKLCEVGDTIPNELFQAVAEVIAFVLNRRRRAA